METKDCLLLGFYDFPFKEYVDMVRMLGEDSGAYRDLALAFIQRDGEPFRALDILSRVCNEWGDRPPVHLHNADFLWPVITYLTNFLRKRGFGVEYVNLPHLQVQELADKFAAYRFNAVVITTTLYVSPHPISYLIKKVRALSPDVRIIVGGPYISNQVKALSRPSLTHLLQQLGADIYVLCQEGEDTLAAVLGALRGQAVLDFIPNLAFFSGSKNLIFTLEHPESNNLADNMVDYAQFAADELGEFVTTRTAKSCPFACAFCGFPARAGDYTYLDVAHVEKEFDAIAGRNQITTVTILDDTFNVPKGRFKEILKMMIRNKYPFKWNSFYRSDHGDEEVIELMARAGCEGVFLGAESGSDEMLARMKKTARRKHYQNAIPAFNACGISTYVSLIVGFPGETDDTVEDTIGLLEEAKPEYYRAQLWYADPVTPVWQDRQKYRIAGQGFHWKHETMDSQQASDWIERMFLRVQNSVWLPQFGFEQWSVFYLQRKGMSREAVRRFLKTFDALIKERLVSHGRRAGEDLYDALRQSCKLRPEVEPEPPILEMWSGSTYENACSAMALELQGFSPQPSEDDGAGKLQCAVRVPIGGETGNRLYECETGLRRATLLAAAAATFSREAPGWPLLAELHSETSTVPVPMRFQTPADGSLSGWVEQALEKTERMARYAHFARCICEDGYWRSNCKLDHLAFEALVRISDGEDTIEPWSLLASLRKLGCRRLVTFELLNGKISCSIYCTEALTVESSKSLVNEIVTWLESHAAASQGQRSGRSELLV